MKLKNVLLTGLSFVLVAAVSIGGTLAYLTSTDDDVNVMTLGNVSIAQHEYERVVNADGTYATKTIDNVTSYVLKDFTQAKPLLPSAIDTTTWEGWDWDSTVVRMTQVDSYGGMQVFKAASNAQDKFVTVENTGDTDAYIRTLVAIEIGSTDGSLIGTSYHSTWTDTDFDPSTTKVSDPLYIQIDGKNYMLQEYIYAGGQLSDGSWRHENGILPAGDTSYPNLSQVYIKSAATNEDMKALDGNGNGTLDILVLSQAVQAKGFADAKTALDTAFGDITTTNHPWIDGADLPTIATTTNELKNALKTKGETVVLTSGTYDMGGNFSIAEGVTLIGSENSVIKGTLTSTMKNITVKNVTFKGGNAQRWAYAKGNVVFENCTFDATSVYAIHYDGTSGADITYKNCDIIGWVAIAGGQNSLTFDGCRIFGNGTYGVIRTYSDTTIKNCTFDVDNVNTTDVYQDGIHAVDCTITVENCTNANGEIDALFNVSGTGKIIKK